MVRRYDTGRLTEPVEPIEPNQTGMSSAEALAGVLHRYAVWHANSHIVAGVHRAYAETAVFSHTRIQDRCSTAAEFQRSRREIICYDTESPQTPARQVGEHRPSDDAAIISHTAPNTAVSCIYPVEYPAKYPVTGPNTSVAHISRNTANCLDCVRKPQ